MQRKRSNSVRPLFLTILLWLCAVALLLLVKDVLEYFTGPIAETWPELALVLIGYLLFFSLAPLQRWVTRRMQKRAKRKSTPVAHQTRS